MTAGRPAQLWEPPSAEVARLIQAAVRDLIDPPADLLSLLDDVVADANRRLLDIDPRLLDPLRAAARSNVAHWAAANLRAPGMPVQANLSEYNTRFAFEVVRHGFDETILAGFRAGQNVVIEYFQDLAFEATEDRAVLQELLHVVTRSVFRYVDDTLAGLMEIIGRERHLLRNVTLVTRLETVSLILEGAPISTRRAGERLGYNVERAHTAAVLWTEADAGEVNLEGVANALAREAGAQRPLVLPVSAGAVWVWMGIPEQVDWSSVREAVAIPPGVFVGVGRRATGLSGFRSSHLEALSVQRLVRRLRVPEAVTTYADVEVVALAGNDEPLARDFMTRTLGDLLSAPAELRDTLATYLAESSNATRTAEVMFAHRNTVISRLDRVRELLPEPIDGRTLKVALALELARVYGHHEADHRRA